MSKLYRARSLLYRRQILEVNIRWKALDEIYKIYMLLHRSDLHISANVRRFFGVFKIRNAKKFDFFKFRRDFHEICSDFLRFSLKTLQLLEIFRFQLNFSMIIPEIHLIFDLIFDLILFNFI